MTTAKILIVEDEPDMLDMLQLNLKKAGFSTVAAESGSAAMRSIQAESPDLILLDIMLPEMSGTEICKRIRAEANLRHIPIIMVSAKGDEVDKVLGFELGADDYVTKPFSVRELILRIRSQLKRRAAPDPEVGLMSCRDITVDRAKHQVRVKGTAVELTPTEFRLLGLLMERRGRVQTRDRLLNDVWEYEASIDTRTVDTHIRRLREKLGIAADYIETVRGVGYRFIEADPNAS